MSGNETCFNEDGLVLSEGYARTMTDRVLPWLAEREEKTVFSGYEGRPLCVRKYPLRDARGTVVIVHGFTECAVKFSEIIYSLLRNGYAVLAYDQRGHGESWRDPDIKDLSLTHVDRFGEYVSDLEMLCDGPLGDMPAPHYALSHSMGGAVTASLLIQRQDIFKKAVFSSPMIAPETGSMPNALMKVMLGAMRLLGKGKERVPVSKPYAGREGFDTACVNGRERFDWYEDLRVRTPAYQNNGPSVCWTLEAISVTGRLLGPGCPERIDCPVRVYQAELENMVVNEAQEKFVSRVKGAELLVVKGAKHEIYRSLDEVLFPWWRGVLDYLARP